MSAPSRTMAGMVAAIALAAVLGLADQRGASRAPEHPRTLVPEASAPLAGANPGIPLDKLLHASGSANLTLGLTALLRVAGLPPRPAALIGAGLTLVVGLAKELLLDALLLRGTADPLDLLADGVGVAAGFAVSGLYFGGTF